jgi:ATP-dependent DNA helicase RecG
VVVLEVKPSDFPPVRYKGRVWIRIGSRKAITNETEERILIEKCTARAATFDARPCYDSSINELNTDVFNAFYLPKTIDKNILKSDTRDIKQKLVSLRFYDLNNDCSTNAFILFWEIILNITSLEPMCNMPDSKEKT